MTEHQRQKERNKAKRIKRNIQHLRALFQNEVERAAFRGVFVPSEKWFSNLVNYIISNYKENELNEVAISLKLSEYETDARSNATALVNWLFENIRFSKIQIKELTN